MQKLALAALVAAPALAGAQAAVTTSGRANGNDTSLSE